MNDKKLNQIHRKVANVLGMKLPDDDDSELDGIEPLVPIPVGTELIEVENPELPVMTNELVRLEHAQRQTDFLIDHALPVVQQSLAESLVMPPIYKARAIEANAKLLEVVSQMLQHKAELQGKIMELEMKKAAFIRNKTPAVPMTGNTFVFNREDVIRAYSEQKVQDDKTEK